MINRILNYVRFINKIDFLKFIKLNYLSKNIIRLDNSKIIPYKNAIIVLSKDCRVYISNGDIELGCDKLRHSKVETLVRLRGKAVWCSTGGCNIAYGTTIEILNNAILDSHYFTMNSRSVLIAAKKIILGKDVMIGRNVILYDSDFHSIYGNNGRIINKSKELNIGSHVWIASNATILKGTYIGSNSIISAGNIVCGNVGKKVIYSTKIVKRVNENYDNWQR